MAVVVLAGQGKALSPCGQDSELAKVAEEVYVGADLGI